MPRKACEGPNFMTLPFSGANVFLHAWLLGLLLTGGKRVKKEVFIVQILRVHDGICDWT